MHKLSIYLKFMADGREGLLNDYRPFLAVTIRLVTRLGHLGYVVPRSSGFESFDPI